MANLGKLEEIRDLRSVWPHEALDFTPWLAEDEHMAILGAALGMEIAADETESAVGDFSVDIMAAEAGTGRKIIIENQLEDTDHDHLGKLITYASGKNANTVIWVVKHAREEHRAAIEWLNSHTDDEVGFFLCEIHLYRIEDSKPAVKFEVIEKPNDWARAVRKNDVLKPRAQLRLEYWTAFNEYAFANTEFARAFNKRKASANHWMDLSIGSSKCHIAMNLSVKESNLVIELYINDDRRLFYALLARKEAIEREMGCALDWQEMKKASRILLARHADFEDREAWLIQFNWLMETAMKYRRVFKKYLKVCDHAGDAVCIER